MSYLSEEQTRLLTIAAVAKDREYLVHREMGLSGLSYTKASTLVREGVRVGGSEPHKPVKQKYKLIRMLGDDGEDIEVNYPIKEGRELELSDHQIRENMQAANVFAKSHGVTLPNDLKGSEGMIPHSPAQLLKISDAAQGGTPQPWTKYKNVNVKVKTHPKQPKYVFTRRHVRYDSSDGGTVTLDKYEFDRNVFYFECPRCGRIALPKFEDSSERAPDRICPECFRWHPTFFPPRFRVCTIMDRRSYLDYGLDWFRRGIEKRSKRMVTAYLLPGLTEVSTPLVLASPAAPRELLDCACTGYRHDKGCQGRRVIDADPAAKPEYRAYLNERLPEFRHLCKLTGHKTLFAV